jgi:hypothetical protein
VFDFYNVLTTNGGNPNVNDLGRMTGNHHRYSESSGVIEHTTNGDNDANADVSEYPSGDDHPSQVSAVVLTYGCCFAWSCCSIQCRGKVHMQQLLQQACSYAAPTQQPAAHCCTTLVQCGRPGDSY